MTYRELKKYLSTLSAKQLDQKVVVTEGCDGNGNADFFTIGEVTKVGDGDVDAGADLLLENGQVVLIQDAPVGVEE
jgi:predicted RNA-binding protein with TRAM domain